MNDKKVKISYETTKICNERVPVSDELARITRGGLEPPRLGQLGLGSQDGVWAVRLGLQGLRTTWLRS